MVSKTPKESFHLVGSGERLLVGETYYLDHNARHTTWKRPTQPTTVSSYGDDTLSPKPNYD
ncbi:hypothetical protein BCR34DRAFT_573215 [Clohesyomyces aquaticus]|uniref:WW domain-containing protein n=1 Tax=Clohesyomyces aquaticus TaxID=1231657 RepID=A0A1Y1Z0N6_9PLEO|nr:hypothetical protein BCR34DRAFT_573215 [Clohesyomyces aquaticus]